MGFTGITQNSITSTVLPLIMALALCDTVHLYSHMTPKVLLRQNNDRFMALRDVLCSDFSTMFHDIVNYRCRFFILIYKQA